MRLYHYTSAAYLNSIMQDGLWKGEVPLTPTDLRNAVWFTKDDSAAQHGLMPRKREVRIAVDIPTTDPKLFRWSRWANKNVTNKAWLKTLTQTGGGKAKADTWWLYFGTIMPDQFVSVDLLTANSNTAA